MLPVFGISFSIAEAGRAVGESCQEGKGKEGRNASLVHRGEMICSWPGGAWRSHPSPAAVRSFYRAIFVASAWVRWGCLALLSTLSASDLVMSWAGCCKTPQTPQNDSCLQAWMSAQRRGAAQEAWGPAAWHHAAACSLKGASQWSSQGLGALLASFHVTFNGFTVIPQHRRGCPCEISPHSHLQVIPPRDVWCWSVVCPVPPAPRTLWHILSWLVWDPRCARLVPHTTSYPGRSSSYITHT